MFAFFVENVALKKVLVLLNKQSDFTNNFARIFIATTKKRPASTTSERAHHQNKFKEDAISRYNAESPNSKDHILCAVLQCYVRRDEVIAAHLCSLDEQDVLPVLGKDISFKWNPKNCVLMFKPLEKLFDALEVTLLYHPDSQRVTFQVLYDHLLNERIVSDFSLFEGYSLMSNNQKKKFRNRFKTYSDLNGKPLLFPSLVLPSKTILNWAAKSAYEAAMRSDLSHRCAEASNPSEEIWKAMFDGNTPSASRLQSFIEDEDISSDYGEEEIFNQEDDIA